MVSVKQNPNQNGTPAENAKLGKSGWMHYIVILGRNHPYKYRAEIYGKADYFNDRSEAIAWLKRQKDTRVTAPDIYGDYGKRNSAYDNKTESVIFRKFQGEVIAFFPYLTGDSSPYTMTSYQHDGQHGTASEDFYRDTKKALSSEYLPLKRELHSLGYKLKVIDRMPSDAMKVRRAELQGLRGNPSKSKTFDITVMDGKGLFKKYRITASDLDKAREKAKQQALKDGLVTSVRGLATGGQLVSSNPKPLSKANNPRSRTALMHDYRARYGITGDFTKQDALDVAEVYSINLNGDFHSLTFDQQSVLNDLAILTGYRKPKTASGSTARYFFNYLGRFKNPQSTKTVSNGITKSDFHQVTNNTYGNPRYVLHFLALAPTYEQALKIGRKFGGRKFHNKQYGGGIVFETYNLDSLADRLNSAAVSNPQPVKRNATAADFKKHQTNRLQELSKMFQGEANGDKHRVIESDYAPKDKYRLGYLVQIKVKDAGKVIPINFNGETAILAGDLKNNLWAVGEGSILGNVPKAARGQLRYLGEVVQVDYVTAKKHIEGGKVVRFYHKLGEVTGEKPNLFIDSDGFPVFVGGGYDIWNVGIVN